MIGSDLLRYQDNQRYNVSDVETNGLNLRSSLPWQLSYAVGTIKNTEKIVTRYIHWPDFKMSDEAARVTRFDMSVYKQRAEDPEAVLKDYEEILFDSATRFTGHNILGFDSYIIHQWRMRLGRTSDWSFLKNCIDTNLLMKAMQKGWQPDRNNLLAWQYKMLDHREKGLKSSLGFACRHFGIDYNEQKAHDAGYDVEVNTKVLAKLIWSVEI